MNRSDDVDVAEPDEDHEGAEAGGSAERVEHPGAGWKVAESLKATETDERSGCAEYGGSDERAEGGPKQRGQGEAVQGQ